MDLRLYPNARRPGVGLKPRRESQRPLLPQHSRHCPVLEAGSSLGFLVFPPLDTNESFVIEFQGEGRYQFTYMMKNPAGQWQPVFAIAMMLPVGGVGVLREDVTFMVRDAPLLREDARQLARSFIVPEDLGTPAGGVTLKGSTNFLTPQGWDTVYTPVLNNIERPVAPMLVVRVETDWYAHETEFRYVLQPGEAISAEHNLPIGQVFFVPREEIRVRDCNEEELTALHTSREEFFREKASHRVKTPYGLEYSPHYLRQSRSQKDR
jgi:hypothetical protein